MTDAYESVFPFLDTTDKYDFRFMEINQDGERLLIVSQSSEFDGGQSIFRWEDGLWQFFDADNFVDVSGTERQKRTFSTSAASQPLSTELHEAVHEVSRSQVNIFSSATGPDGGNLACVWAVRHLIKNGISRWVTRTDGTSVFDAELRRFFGGTWNESDVVAGGIVISPTATNANGTRNIGHVGILGPGGTGQDRLIYSNSSSRKRWEQNFTLASWIERYRNRKGLPVRFFPLPDLQ